MIERVGMYPTDSIRVELWKSALKDITTLLKTWTFTEFFNSAAASLAQLMNADGAALIVYNGPKQLRYRLFYGLENINQRSVTKFSFDSHQGTVGQVLTTGKYLFTHDYPNSAASMPEFVQAGLRSNLVLPLPGPDGFAGAVTIAWIKRQADFLTDENIIVAEMFAALIGSAIHQEKLQRQLEHLSLTDPLTKLPNRRMFELRLLEAQKRACRNQSLMVLAVIDLDGFKMINDKFGHELGDQKLIAAAAAIKSAIRDVDMVARFGGDEFVIILESLKSYCQIKHVLDRIVRAVDVLTNEGLSEHRLSASLGATIYPNDFVDPESLLKHSDEAMYFAKKYGGNQFFISEFAKE